jgi:hypothetical protein
MNDEKGVSAELLESLLRQNQCCVKNKLLIFQETIVL